jgi:predicted dehydrogenase
MTPRAVLFGVGSEQGRQHHQRDMYLPALRDLDTEVVGLIATGERADRFRSDEGLPAVDLDTVTGDVDVVVACPDPERVADLDLLLRHCAQVEVPVLLDKPTLLPTATLREWAARYRGVIAAHHCRFHGAMAAVGGRVRAGDLGLLHAVHGELLVANGDGAHPSGELRNLAVHGLDVVQSMIGDLHGRGATMVEPPVGSSGESITIAVRCRPDVVVTLLVGRCADEAVPGVVHRYRILGSHGQALVDLAGPSLELPGGARIPFGPSSVARMITAVLAGARAPGLDVAAGLAEVIDAMSAPGADLRSVDF